MKYPKKHCGAEEFSIVVFLDSEKWFLGSLDMLRLEWIGKCRFRRRTPIAQTFLHLIGKIIFNKEMKLGDLN